MANGLDILTPIQQGIGIASALQQRRQQQALTPIQQQLAGLQLEQGQLGLETGRAELQQMQEQNRLRSIVTGAAQALNLPPEQRLPFLLQRRQQLQQQGKPTMDTDEAISLAQAGDQEGLQAALQQTVGLGQQLGLLEAPGVDGGIQQAVAVPGLGFQALTRGGEAQFLELSREEQEQIRAAQEAKRKEELEQVSQKERAKLLAQQRQDISTEIRNNAREARRQQPRIDQLLTALDQVETGKLAQAKAIFGQFIPGVDPSDEQALGAAMNDLIFDQLARFTGAISEGERDFAKRTSANLGFTNKANRIILERLKARLSDTIAEDEQFKRFIAEGGKAENFEFEAPVTTKVSPKRPFFSRVLNREVTEDEIQETLDNPANAGVTREQLLGQLGIERTGEQPETGFVELPQ